MYQPPPYGPPPPPPPGGGYPPYTPPPYGYGAPPQGPGFGPPGWGMPPGMGPSPTSELDKESTTWMLVAIIGFMTGFFVITGPLAWYQGSRLRQQYISMGAQPSSQASAAWIVGIVSTVATVFVAGLLCLLFGFAFSIAH